MAKMPASVLDESRRDTEPPFNNGERPRCARRTQVQHIPRYVFVTRPLHLPLHRLPVRVYRHDVATGRKDLWKEIVPPDPVGFIRINRFLATAWDDTRGRKV